MSHFASIYDEIDAFFGILQVLIFPVLLLPSFSIQQTALKDKKASFSAQLLYTTSKICSAINRGKKMCKIRMLYKHLEFRPSFLKEVRRRELLTELWTKHDSDKLGEAVNLSRVIQIDLELRKTWKKIGKRSHFELSRAKRAKVVRSLKKKHDFTMRSKSVIMFYFRAKNVIV